MLGWELRVLLFAGGVSHDREGKGRETAPAEVTQETFSQLHHNPEIMTSRSLKII